MGTLEVKSWERLQPKFRFLMFEKKLKSFVQIFIQILIQPLKLRMWNQVFVRSNFLIKIKRSERSNSLMCEQGVWSQKLLEVSEVC